MDNIKGKNDKEKQQKVRQQSNSTSQNTQLFVEDDMHIYI